MSGGDDGGFFRLDREQSGLTRICAEQRAALDTLAYGGESHANSEGVHGLAV